MKPILFNTEMVRAILDGRKTATRRLIKPQPLFKNDIIYRHENGKWYISPDNDNFGESEIKSKYQTGDILYARETWSYLWSAENPKTRRFVYRATDTYSFAEKYIAKFKWHPSIHMPKEAARIFLRVKDVRVERLQEITDEQAIAEGIIPQKLVAGKTISPKYSFVNLWDSTLKPANLDRYGWEVNPWVWVIEFERISKEEAYESER